MTKQQLKDLIKEVISEVDKSSLHKELIAINDRIKYMRSFTNYGDTISGSHVKDQQEIGKLIKRKEEILKSLKSTNENYEDGIKEGSDYDKMTPQQKHQYEILRDLGWEYDYTENKDVYMNRWDRGSDSSSKLATMIIKPDGEHHRIKSTNESEGFRIKPQPKSPLEGAVVSYVDNDGHYHADIILKTKEGREVKGRFEYHRGQFAFESATNVGGIQGYIFGPMDAARSWISKHQAPKTKNGRQRYVVSAAAFQQAFPNMKPQPIDTKKISPHMDYFTIDGEGDLMPISQANVGSGLD